VEITSKARLFKNFKQAITMKTIITVDGFETTLAEFINTNTKQKGVDHIADEDVERVKSLKLGYSLNIGLVKIVAERIEYRGYTIENAQCPYAYMLHFYKTEVGIDCEFDGDSWSSNVTPTNSIEDAKREIDDLILESQKWPVDMGGYHKVFEFTWLETALNYLHGHGSRAGAMPLFAFDSM
jgi:hypothetical protein